MFIGALLGALINLNGSGRYIHWGFIQISVANLVVIVLMVIVFVLAILIPFTEEEGRRPMSIDTGDPGREPAPTTTATDSSESRQWTAKVRHAAGRALPPQQLLPDRQPAYVASWIYVFGVLTVVSLGLGHHHRARPRHHGPELVARVLHRAFVNSLHLWSVEVFFFAMVVHLWGKFFMAAWRGKRTPTWITGVVSFLVSVGAAFTGYLSQQNFDSQWISTQAKDGINSTGAGAIFNVTNFGQMIMWHIVLLPLVRGRSWSACTS